MRRWIPGALIVGGLVLSQAVLSSSHSVSDREFGLSKSTVFETPDPPAFSPNRSEPGEDPRIPRGFADAPPVIPHGVSDYLPITLSENMCLECHLVKEKIEGEPTPVPESHFRDLRRDPDTVSESIAGARYVCNTCHVSGTDAEDLVGNGF